VEYSAGASPFDYLKTHEPSVDMTEAQSLEQSGHIALVIRNAKAFLDYLLQINAALVD